MSEALPPKLSIKPVRYPRCVNGKRACPPEDSGGPYGYRYFLDNIQDPEHDEHEETLEWVGDEFDPEISDLEDINEGLRYLRRWLGKRKGRPALQAAFIDRSFGVAESTGQGKSKTIRTMFRIRQFDPMWTLPSKMDDNPMVWMLEVNGLLMDIRNAPRELQEVAFEKGLIPYIPADRTDAGEIV